MTQDNKDDEYQFSDIESNQVFDEDPAMDNTSVTSMPADNNLKKVIIMAFGVIIVGFLVYKFLAPYFEGQKQDDSSPKVSRPSQSSKVKPVVAASNQAKLLPPVSKPQVQPQPVVMPQVQRITQQVSDPKIDQKLDSLQYSTRQASRNIQNINNHVGALKDAIVALNGKMTSLNANIAILSQEVQKQQMMINKMKEKPKKKVMTKRVMKPKQNYHIQAVIPGRAWLKSTKGNTITVVEGSVIPGWGKVKIIDPHQGHVLLSSGRVIKFNTSDI